MSTRVMKIFIAILVVAIVLLWLVAGVVAQQEPPLPSGGVGHLRALGLPVPPEQRYTLPCGPYFQYVTVAVSGFPPNSFKFVFDGRDRNGTLFTSIQILPGDKFRVRIVEGLPFPIAVILRTSGPVLPWLEVQMSAKDRAQAMCLDHLGRVI